MRAGLVKPERAVKPSDKVKGFSEEVTFDMKMELVSSARKLPPADVASLVNYMAQLDGVNKNGNDGDGSIKLSFANFSGTSYRSVIGFIDHLLL